KEQLGGYYIVDADDLDDAIAWAAKLPTAEHGTIEVRPLMNLPDM
ncbi:MAG: YciI family protein, partial [Alphaproteobacteria bacterium]